MLADSLRKTFDDLFTQISQNVDLRVRSSVAFGDDDVQVQRDPIPASLLATVEGVEGVAATEPLLQRFAQIVAPDGEVVTTAGRARRSASAGPATRSCPGLDDQGRHGAVRHRPGRHRQGDGRPRGHRRRRRDPGDHRHRHVPVHGHRARRPRRQRRLRRRHARGMGRRDGRSRSPAPATSSTASTSSSRRGADPAAVTTAARGGAAGAAPRSSTARRSSRRPRPGSTSSSAPFGNGLLGFAFVTAFVSAFLINNVFQITIGQRLRELAMMRAVGARGSQVRRLIYLEALIMSVVATVLGIGRRRARGARTDLGVQLRRRRVPEQRPRCCCRARSCSRSSSASASRWRR